MEEIDATGLTVVPAYTHADTLDSVTDLTKLDLPALRREGILVFPVRKAPNGTFPTQAVHVLNEGKLPAQPPALEQIPTFLLMKGKQIQYRFVNGFWKRQSDWLTKRCG